MEAKRRENRNSIELYGTCVLCSIPPLHPNDNHQKIVNGRIDALLRLKLPIYVDDDKNKRNHLQHFGLQQNIDYLRQHIVVAGMELIIWIFKLPAVAVEQHYVDALRNRLHVACLCVQVDNN